RRTWSATMRKSAASASSSPPPNALPCTTAITGCRSRARRSKTLCPRTVHERHMSSGPRPAKRSMSAPAQNARSPAARRTTTRIHRRPVAGAGQLDLRALQDVGLEVNARRDLGHRQAVGTQLEDAALGDVLDALALVERAAARERDLVDALDELGQPAIGAD